MDGSCLHVGGCLWEDGVYIPTFKCGHALCSRLTTEPNVARPQTLLQGAEPWYQLYREPPQVPACTHRYESLSKIEKVPVGLDKRKV